MSKRKQDVEEEPEEDEEPRYTLVFEGEDKKLPHVSKDGTATATFENGDTYKGEYKAGKRHGKGTYVYKSSGARYSGDWAENKKSGTGELLMPDKGKYVGDFKDDKRTGQGTYTYPNGDSYTGGWLDGVKHGRGTYTYAAGGSGGSGVVAGNWVHGRLLQGQWDIPDGSKYIGTFTQNTPSGDGLLVHSNGIARSGRFDEAKFVPDAFAKPGPAAAPCAPAASAADPFKQTQRTVDKAVLKVDHFVDIHRLPKEIEAVAGAPNYRQIGEWPVFGVGQPTFDGMQSVLENLQEAKLDNIVWFNLRVEPVIFVNDLPFAPRDKADINNNMRLPGLSKEQLGQLEERLAERVRTEVKRRSGLHFYVQDTFAEVPQERQNSERILEVKEPYGEQVRTLAQVYERLQEDGFKIELVRVPLADSGRAPPLDTWDALVAALKDLDAGTAVVFNCQMGRGRTTLGTIIASLVRRALDGGEEEKEEEPAPEEEEDLDDEEEEEEVEGEEELDDDQREERRNKRRAERKAARLAEKERKRKEAEEEEEHEQFDVKQGQYAAVMKLVKALPGGSKKGAKIKAEVDDVIDRCKHLEHFRDAIFAAKEQFEAADGKESKSGGPSRRQFWKETAVNALERYFYLIAFNAYLKEAVPAEFATPFSKWVAEHPAYFELLGSRQSGALADFNWV